jgi:uncharacterized protein (DUF952 family)
MEIILHITTWTAWEQAQVSGLYYGDTLATEGFIHCSTPEQVAEVANRIFSGRHDLVLLCIAPSRVQPEIRYELAENGNIYPHIYGPLNVDAVMSVIALQPGEDGRFTLPPGVDSLVME